MTATLQTVLNANMDLRQILVTVAANEVGTDIELPVHGSTAVISANEQVFCQRIIPTDSSTASMKVTLKSKTNAGATTFSSPAIQLAEGQGLNSSIGTAPIFASSRGDRMAINSDAAGSFLVFVSVVDRYAAAL